MKNNKKFLYTFFVIITATLFLIYIAKVSNDKVIISKNMIAGDVSTIDKAIIKCGEQEYPLTLPNYYTTNCPYEIKYNLSEVSDLSNKIVDVHILYSNFTCYMDGEPIYFYNVGKNNCVKSGASRVHYIEFPSNIKVPELTIKVEPIFQSNSRYHIARLKISDTLGLVREYVVSDVLMIIFTLVLFSIFVGLTVFNSLIQKEEGFNWQVFHLSMLCLLMAIYMFTQLQIQFLFGYSTMYFLVRYAVEFYSLSILPVPVLYMVKYDLDTRWARILEISGIVLILQGMIQFLLTIFTDYEFKLLLKISHGFIVVSILLVIVSILTTNSNQYPRKMRVLYSLIPVIITFLLGIVFYYFSPNFVYKEFLVLGSIMFVIVNIYLFMKEYKNTHNLNFELDTYKKISRIDYLTEMPNRVAYNEDIACYSSLRNEYSTLGFIVVDIQKLRLINRMHGFDAGDAVIQNMAKYLKHIVEKENNVFVYRTGSSEFVMILKNINYENLAKISDRIDSLKDKHHGRVAFGKGEEQYEYTFSVGYSIYFPHNKSNLSDVLWDAENQIENMNSSRSVLENENDIAYNFN